MMDKTLKQMRAEIRAKIALDSKMGIRNAFWLHIEYLTWGL